MATLAARRRRVVFMRKLALRKKRLTPQEQRFKEALSHVIDDLSHIFSLKENVRDFLYLRRLSLNVKQLYFDAKRLTKCSKHKGHAEKVIHFLETPWGAPTVIRRSLLEAADRFSEQNPKYSDLNEWVTGISWYGPAYKKLILSLLHD